MGVLVKLHLKKLSKCYPNGCQALSEITATLPSGQITALLGPNGAGKSTLVRILAGLISPSSGDILMDGSLFKIRNRYKDISMTFEEHRTVYAYLTAKKNIQYFGSLKGVDSKTLRKRTDNLLDCFDLTKVADQPVSTFSLGMKKKVSLAVALVNEPRILLLDEPTMGLDVTTTQNLLEIVREKRKGRITLLTSHQMNIVSDICDKIVIIDSGHKIFEGDTADIRKKDFFIIETTGFDNLELPGEISWEVNRKSLYINSSWQEIVSKVLPELLKNGVEILEVNRGDLKEFFLNAIKKVHDKVD